MAAWTKLSTGVTGPPLQNFLQCSLCSGNYKDPRILQCSHFFCLICLEKYVSSITQTGGEDSNSFPCKICSKKLQLPKEGLQSIPKMLFIETSLAMSLDKPLRVHEELLSNRMKDLEDAQSMYCDKHPGEKLEYFCNYDNACLCFKCKIESHSDHSYVIIDNAQEYFTDQLNTLTEELKIKLEILKNKQEINLKHKKRCLGQKQSVERMLRVQANQLIQEIENCYQENMRKVQACYDQEEKQMAKHTEDLDIQYAHAESTYKVAIKLIQNGHPPEVVQVNKLLRENFYNMRISEPPSYNSNFLMKYSLHLVDPHKIQELFGTIQMQIAYKNIHHVQAFNTTTSVDSQNSKICGLSSMENGTIVVSDFWNKNVKQFTCFGKLCRELTTPSGCSFVEPQDICLLENGDLAVADFDANHIKIFSKAGKFVKTMLDQKVEQPCGLACNSKGHLVVSEMKTQKVHVYDQHESLLHTIQHTFKWPGYVAVTPQDGIIVSDYSAHCITAFNSSGELLFTYGTKGSHDNQFNRPGKVCVDPQGNILVADELNNRIHLIGPDGKFRYYVAAAVHFNSPKLVNLSQQGDLIIGEDKGVIKVIRFKE